MLDLERLTAPISEAMPCGQDMSFSSEFDAIAEARRSDDPTLEQGDWVADLKTAEWGSVVKQCNAVLLSKTKDMRVAAWLTEASARTESFAGLAQGYRLIAQLCEAYWDGIYPNDDIEERIGSLSWLLSNSSRWIRELPLIDNGPQARYSMNDFEAARAKRSSSSSDNFGEVDTRPSMEMLDSARRGTSYDFYVQLTAALPECVSAVKELERVMDARLGLDGPSFTSLLDQLVSVDRLAKRFARDAGVAVEGDFGEAETETESSSAGGSSNSASGGGSGFSGNAGDIAGRKQALAELRRVAEYFRRTEPHSPVAYLAERAARWGEMPLHIWLKTVVKEGTSLAQLEELLDIGQATNFSSDD
jgi:type VI secretion system protein ImpA